MTYPQLRGTSPESDPRPARRVPWLFAAVGMAAAALPLAARFAFSGDSSTDLPTAVAVVGSLAAGGAVLALWQLVQALVLRPAATLARETRLIAHGGTGARMPLDRFAELLPLPEAINELAEKMVRARQDIDRAVAESTAKAEEQKTRLAAILNDLHEGVLVCNLQHQILLYNQTALDLLHFTGELGLGRSLLQVMLEEPITHTLERLGQRVREGRHRGHEQGAMARFVGGTRDGRVLLQGRMGLILHDEGTDTRESPAVITGYVVTFTDVTGELAVLGQRDALLREASEGFRVPVANMRALLEILADTPDMDEESRVTLLEGLANESMALSERLEKLTRGYQSVITGHWPMSDIHTHNLINLVIHRIGVEDGYTVTLTGLPHWLYGDSYSLVVMLHHLLGRLHDVTRLTSFDMTADASEHWVYIDIAWEGVPVASALIDRWKDQPLPTTLGGLTVGDVLQHHRSDLWSESGRDGYARLRVPLPLAQESHQRRTNMLTARPEFFDFSLLHQPLATGSLGGMPLERLTYVVFDTETTGLHPSQGDEVVSIAGVRIVNGRILTGETFNVLVNPRRPIPPESIPFHGITDEMVRDQPGIDTVLPQFKAFISGAVLVAHNAAFDLKFLRMKERSSGVRIDNPVLDTMLLSRMLTGEDGDHTLDGIAARLGVTVVDRHTAVGDSVVTAAVFLRMLAMLQERGIHTLDDAIRGANILVELHQRERAF